MIYLEMISYKRTCNFYFVLPGACALILLMYVRPQTYKNKRNNYSNIFIALGALKSLLCFPSDIDANDILNYHTNYLLRKCRKKTIANKQDCLSTRILVATFHKTALKYESDLKFQLVLLDVSTKHNVGLPRFLHFKFCQMIYLFKTFIML